MGRIENYINDSEFTGADKFVGTNSDGSITSNYPIEKLIALVDNREASVDLDTRHFKMILDNFDFTNIPANYDNAVWFIRYNHNLLTQTSTLPANVTLLFAGGSITNGTLTGDNTKIESEAATIFSTTTTLAGSWGIKEVMVDWFGAVGDGTTNDYIAINKAITSAVAMSTRNIKLSAGKNYLIGTTLVLNYDNFIFDLNSSMITTTGDIVAINLGAILSSGNSFTKTTIKNGIITGSGTGLTNNRAIVARNISLAVVSNMKFTNFGAKPLLLSSDTRGMQYNNFKDIEIVDNFDGAIKLEVGSTGSYVNDNSFFNIRCHDTPRTGGGSAVILDIQGGTTEVIEGNRFLSCAFESQDAAHTLVNLNNTDQNSFFGCRLDGIPATKALQVSADSHANYFWLQGTDGTITDLSERSFYLNKKGSNNFPYLEIGDFQIALEQSGSLKELEIKSLTSGGAVRLDANTKGMFGDRDGADNAPFTFHSDLTPPLLEVLTQTSQDANRPRVRFRDEINNKNFYVTQTSVGLVFESDGSQEPFIIRNDGTLESKTNAYNKALILGTNYLWVDATGDLRIKSSAPSSDLDGTVVGTQT